MVEGPGCKLKGEKMKATVKGQKVVCVGGNVIDNHPKTKTNIPSPYHLLRGHHVVDVKTLGKELFLIFDHASCVRVHFLMSGYVRYNDQQSDPDETSNKKTRENPRLELELDKDTISFYQCSTDLRNTEECLSKWERMITLDICWKMFDSVRATDRILEESNQDRMVCDVIMDQDVLPGVGNIIKNEACFDAGINPLSKIKELKREHISHLVKMNRDFSMVFYNCRKYGKPLHKHFKMYRFSVCKQCGGKVTKCKPGEYERGTYFCSRCQNNDLRSGPSKNSVLGWAKLAASNGQSHWTCVICTLENKPGCMKCGACGSDKEQDTKHLGTKRKSTEMDMIPTLGCKRQKVPGGDASNNVEASFVSITPKLMLSKTTVVHKGDHTFTFKSPEVRNSSVKKNLVSVLKCQNGENSNSEMKTEFKKDVNQTKVELCKGHGAPCTKKVVSKDGPNKLRLFWTCSLPKAKSCNHFSWADLGHPKCKHGAISLLREVYKMNENNGREFFVCPKSKKDQCDFFQWNDK